MADQRGEGGVATTPAPETPPTRPWTAVLGQRFPIRRVILVVLGVLIAFCVLSASLFLQYSFAGFFGSDAKGYPDVKPLTGTLNVFGFPMAKTQALAIVTAIIMMVALTLFIAKTRTGKAMRAVAEDKEVASLMGIDIDRVIVTTFAIGG